MFGSGLLELDTVAEWIERMESPHAGNLARCGKAVMPGGAQRGFEGIEVCHEKCWMCFTCWLKVLLHTEMQHGRARLEPTAASRGEGGWLRCFVHAEQACVERSRGGLRAGGNGHLYMVEADDHGLAATTKMRRNSNAVP